MENLILKPIVMITKLHKYYMKLHIKVILFIFALLFFIDAEQLFGQNKVVETICEKYILSNLENDIQIITNAKEQNSNDILYLDTIVHFSNPRHCYVKTHIVGTNYNINIYVNSASAKCSIISYGQAGYEKYLPRNLFKLIKIEKRWFLNLDDSDYYKTIFDLITPYNLCIYSRGNNGKYFSVVTRLSDVWCDKSIIEIENNSRFNAEFLFYSKTKKHNNIILFDAYRNRNQHFEFKLITSNYKFKKVFDDLVGAGDATVGIMPIWKHVW